jgi:hypothetical protein
MAKKKAAEKKTVKKKATSTKAAKKSSKKATKTATKKKTAADVDGKTVKKKAKKKATKRKSKAAADVRLKLFWGVFTHAMKRVALYEFNQRKAADKRAKELSESRKLPHFVQKVKEPVEE